MSDKITTTYNTESTEIGDGGVNTGAGGTTSIVYNSFSIMSGLVAVSLVLGVYTIMGFRR